MELHDEMESRHFGDFPAIDKRLDVADEVEAFGSREAVIYVSLSQLREKLTRFFRRKGDDVFAYL